MIGVYIIKSPSNGIYIGQSWDIKNRIRKYLKHPNYISEQRLLMRSFNKYGVENHSFGILKILNCDTTQEELDNYEIRFIKFHKENNYKMLNIKEGGSRGKLSKITIERMKKALKGRKSPNKGKKLSKEIREKISKVKIGTKQSIEAIEKRKISIKNRPRTELEEIQFKNFRLKGCNKIKKKVLKVSQNGEIQEYESIAEASRITKVIKTGICNVLNGRSKTAGGFIWMYAESQSK